MTQLLTRRYSALVPYQRYLAVLTLRGLSVEETARQLEQVGLRLPPSPKSLPPVRHTPFPDTPLGFLEFIMDDMQKHLPDPNAALDYIAEFAEFHELDIELVMNTDNRLEEAEQINFIPELCHALQLSLTGRFIDYENVLKDVSAVGTPVGLSLRAIYDFQTLFWSIFRLPPGYREAFLSQTYGTGGMRAASLGHTKVGLAIDFQALSSLTDIDRFRYLRDMVFYYTSTLLPAGLVETKDILPLTRAFTLLSRELRAIEPANPVSKLPSVVYDAGAIHEMPQIDDLREPSQKQGAAGEVIPFRVRARTDHSE